VPPHEPKIRVFISHSANSEDVQEGLVAALKEPARVKHFEPLLDKDELRPGDMWRARINLWAGGCDAAIVLLSDAALGSDWVFYEASLLSYRCLGDPSFLVVPVCLGTVDQAKLEASRFHRVLQLADIQAVHGAGRPAADVVSQIVRRLEEKALYSAATPAQQRAQCLAKQLAGFGEDQLQQAADWLGLDLDLWMPGGEARLRLAVQLMSVGMESSVAAVESLLGNLPPSVSDQGRVDWLKRVLDLIASAWVDENVVGRICPIARREEGWAALGINASSPQTVKMYVLGASRNEPRPWEDVPECDGVAAADTFDQLVQKLGDKVERVLASHLKCSPANLPRVLKNRYYGHPRPVFVAMPGKGITKEILTALRTRFEHVTFFLLMDGPPLESPPPFPQEVLEILFPQLVPGDEALFLEGYESFRGRFFAETGEILP
jgi:TIR domain-containing protein